MELMDGAGEPLINHSTECERYRGRRYCRTLRCPQAWRNMYTCTHVGLRCPPRTRYTPCYIIYAESCGLDLIQQKTTRKITHASRWLWVSEFHPIQFKHIWIKIWYLTNQIWNLQTGTHCKQPNHMSLYEYRTNWARKSQTGLSFFVTISSAILKEIKECFSKSYLLLWGPNHQSCEGNPLQIGGENWYDFGQQTCTSYNK